MVVQKVVFALSLTFSTLTSMTTIDNNSLFANECEIMVQFNNTMDEKLELTDKQLKVILDSNKDYLLSRKDIINNSNMIGQNTALLASWNKWRIAIAEKLTTSQMEKFMQWQSQVDLLGSTPF